MLKGVRHCGRPFSFCFLIHLLWEKARGRVAARTRSQAAEAASLLVNFLAIVSWFALLSAKRSISKELAAPRAKETIYRENHQDRSHFLHILVRIGGIRTIPCWRPRDTTHAAATSGTATHAALTAFNSAIAARTRPKRATWPAARSCQPVPELIHGTTQH